MIVLSLRIACTRTPAVRQLEYGGRSERSGPEKLNKGTVCRPVAAVRLSMWFWPYCLQRARPSVLPIMFRTASENRRLARASSIDPTLDAEILRKALWSAESRGVGRRYIVQLLRLRGSPACRASHHRGDRPPRREITYYGATIRTIPRRRPFLHRARNIRFPQIHYRITTDGGDRHWGVNTAVPETFVIGRGEGVIRVNYAGPAFARHSREVDRTAHQAIRSRVGGAFF